MVPASRATSLALPCLALAWLFTFPVAQPAMNYSALLRVTVIGCIEVSKWSLDQLYAKNQKSHLLLYGTSVRCYRLPSTSLSFINIWPHLHTFSSPFYFELFFHSLNNYSFNSYSNLYYLPVSIIFLSTSTSTSTSLQLPFPRINIPHKPVRRFPFTPCKQFTTWLCDNHCVLKLCRPWAVHCHCCPSCEPTHTHTHTQFYNEKWKGWLGMWIQVPVRMR